MNIKSLHRILNDLIAAGAGRREVCVDKSTFTHPLESDGATILNVDSAEAKVIELADEDGGTKTLSNGRVATRYTLVLSGDGEKGEALRKSQWISVERRLPADFTSVLGWVTGGPSVVHDPFADCVCYDSKRKVWLQSIGTEDQIVSVTHWMPLPFAPLKNPKRHF